MILLKIFKELIILTHQSSKNLFALKNMEKICMEEKYFLKLHRRQLVVKNKVSAFLKLRKRHSWLH